MANRSLDGSGNNLANPTWGQAGIPLLRVTPVGYTDGVSAMPDRGGTNPREISNRVCMQNNPNPSALGLTDYVWAWGQFLDHELDLTEAADPEELAAIPVDRGDPNLPRGGMIPFRRSEHVPSPNGPRQQLNRLSAYVDAANVYGVDPDRLKVLRADNGRLAVTPDVDHGDLLPLNTTGLPNAGSDRMPAGNLFLAGDVRANEHAVLTSMHTLFVREHNRLCAEFQAQGLTDDEALFQKARKFVGAIMQAITYSEFLPSILGSDAIPSYPGYKGDVDAGIANVFSTACYRIGHSMLSSSLRVGASETLALRDAFFSPGLIFDRGIEPFLDGLHRQQMQQVDVEIIDDVRSFLFDPPAPPLLMDLAALNIQRGRDHGLPSYNDCREAFGLARRTSFDEITGVNRTANRLRQAYGSVDDVDPWLGGLAEDHVPGAAMGEFFRTVLIDQFVRVRDGDRFWFDNDSDLTPAERAEIAGTRLSDVINRNTGLSVPADVFHV